MEEVKDVATGLVHSGNDSHPFPGSDPGDVAHDVVGGGAIQPAGGLVEEKQPRPCQHLNADAHPLPLPAADALGDTAADARVHGVAKPHLPDYTLRVGALL
ncbi:Os12g0412050 [Oryza sativa Japonica Group]|uniref:Os12g0412050 protein n=1 Tax=Oryza sativa subsp. japonica TaxID=39947 RepID=A0A0P0Y9C9_ORYSJ|nr:hypothetical protein EE612_059162 [Oryza sativa]BAT16867.1 Os12g0412050 [Oryza sativa Japonica Group]